MRAQWTEGSAFKAVQAWLRLSTSQQTPVNLIAAQNYAMAIGAKKAFQELADYDAQERWTRLLYTGNRASLGTEQFAGGYRHHAAAGWSGFGDDGQYPQYRQYASGTHLNAAQIVPGIGIAQPRGRQTGQAFRQARVRLLIFIPEKHSPQTSRVTERCGGRSLRAGLCCLRVLPGEVWKDVRRTTMCRLLHPAATDISR